MFFRGTGGDKNEKLGNSLKLSLLLWIVFCKSDVSLRVNKVFA